MSFLPHKKFTWADFGGYILISPRRYAPDDDDDDDDDGDNNKLYSFVP